MKQIPWISIAMILITGLIIGPKLASKGVGTVQEPDPGKGPVEPGPISLKGANLGAHWSGPEISHNDLKGKVVLFEIYGS